MVLQVAAAEPVIVDGAQFVVERALDVPGSVAVAVGDSVEPERSIAVASAPSGRVMTLHLARELGVAPGSIAQYLTKPIGSSFEAGEAVARSRRGLRSTVASAPFAGTVTEIDETAGTAILIPATSQFALEAMVFGRVEALIDDRGALISTSGSRVRGALGLGASVVGPIRAAIDRADRELTADAIGEDLRGSVVLAGMTAGAATMRRLAEVGARAVVMGSVSEAEIRRAVYPGRAPAVERFWRDGSGTIALMAEVDRVPLTVFVTEGFGRRPMAGPVFDFLAEHEGQLATILAGRPGVDEGWPYLFFSTAPSQLDERIPRVVPSDGIRARLADPAQLGTVVVCRGGVIAEFAHGGRREVVEVETGSGGRLRVPLANLEILGAS
ncbi:MAG TPA: hypothetical protein VMU89_00875 [Thermomicrobiaceae bacterium]|nr:hypothetical protein [Thermomicrobiaceae bacterium]